MQENGDENVDAGATREDRTTAQRVVQTRQQAHHGNTNLPRLLGSRSAIFSLLWTKSYETEPRVFRTCCRSKEPFYADGCKKSMTDVWKTDESIIVIIRINIVHVLHKKKANKTEKKLLIKINKNITPYIHN